MFLLTSILVSLHSLTIKLLVVAERWVPLGTSTRRHMCYLFDMCEHRIRILQLRRSNARAGYCNTHRVSCLCAACQHHAEIISDMRFELAITEANEKYKLTAPGQREEALRKAFDDEQDKIYEGILAQQEEDAKACEDMRIESMTPAIRRGARTHKYQ